MKTENTDSQNTANKTLKRWTDDELYDEYATIHEALNEGRGYLEPEDIAEMKTELDAIEAEFRNRGVDF